MIKKYLLTLIRVYQKTISPDHGLTNFMGGFYKCRFYPTCSEYSYQAILEGGVLRGLLYACKRVARCSGFHKGGHDPFVAK